METKVYSGVGMNGDYIDIHTRVFDRDLVESGILESKTASEVIVLKFVDAVVESMLLRMSPQIIDRLEQSDVIKQIEEKLEAQLQERVIRALADKIAKC